MGLLRAFRAWSGRLQAAAVITAVRAGAGFEAGIRAFKPKRANSYRNRRKQDQRPEREREQLEVPGVGIVVCPQDRQAWTVGAM